MRGDIKTPVLEIPEPLAVQHLQFLLLSLLIIQMELLAVAVVVVVAAARDLPQIAAARITMNLLQQAAVAVVVSGLEVVALAPLVVIF
jgi:hypothetical protein